MHLTTEKNIWKTSMHYMFYLVLKRFWDLHTEI